MSCCPIDPYANPERASAWSDEAERRLRAMGATSVVTASSLPFRHEWDSTTFVDITNRPTDPASRPNGRSRVVSPGFFEALEMRIVAGRSFSRDDRLDAPPVVVVNRTWARKFLPGLDPLRERVNPGRFATRVDGKWVARDAEIIGVVEDVPYSDLTKAAEPTIYVSDLQAMTLRRSIVITSETATRNAWRRKFGSPSTVSTQVFPSSSNRSRRQSRHPLSGPSWGCC